MIITVVSGKGGAGKTSITAAVAHAMPKDRIVLIDADVDTPNLALALGLERPVTKEDWRGLVVAEYVGGNTDPKICPFGAIGTDGNVNELLCEGCGVCVKKFPKSYRLKNVKGAEILEYRWDNVPLMTAELEPGRSGSGKIVAELRDLADRRGKEEKRDIQLIDAAAGRGCPVIASIRGADLAILVVDNTPTGISDAEAVVSVLKHFNVPFLFLINRYDLAEERVEDIVNTFTERGGTYIGRIPYDPDILRTYPVPVERILKHINAEEILKRI
ncbi:MAG: P-loop NTPase [Candidatus Diapherotrites archaeon]|nr:P-loop NTPase [Candidatus Diapherotrites archaeon]